MVVSIGRKRSTVPSRKSPRYVIRSTSEARKILKYLRKVAPWPGSGVARPVPADGLTGRVEGASTSARDSGGVMAGAGLLEDAGDDLFERRVLDPDVDDLILVEDRPQDLGHPRALHLQVDLRALGPGHLAEAGEVVGLLAVGELQLHELRI